MRGATNNVRALQAAIGATLIGLLVCVAIISQAQLRRPVSLASKNAKAHHHSKAKAAHAKKGGGSFVLNYLKSNKDVDESPVHDDVHRLSSRQVRGMGRGNVDQLGAQFRSVRNVAVGPDGLADPGDIADNALVSSLAGQLRNDEMTSDAIDYRHRAKFDTTLGFTSSERMHDMAHAAAAADERVTLGTAGGGSFSTLASADQADVDALGTSADADVWGMVKKATAEPSRQDVHLGRVAKEAGLRGDAAVASSSLAGAAGDSEAEAMADPRHDEVMAAQAEAAPDPKGIWIEPGSGKNGDSFALDSLQVHGSA